MAGPQTPVIKAGKAYGDQKALDSLKRAGSGLKYDKAGPVTERRGAGRPAGPSAGTGAQQMQPVAPGIPAEHVALIEDFSRASLVAQVASAAAQDVTAGPWLRQYAQRADADLARKAEVLRSQTPFFEE